jgi:hypothetical protein
VRLDGKPIRAGNTPVVPIGRVEDDGQGFKVRVVRDPAIQEVFRNGIVRCGDELRAVSDGSLSPEQRTILGRGISFEPSEVGKLVSEVIPDLRKKVPVEIRTSRLPQEGEPEPPYILLDTKVVGHQLSVLPLLVYGKPPTARIDRGELVMLGKTVPVRAERTERKLQQELIEILGLNVGIRKDLGGEAAVDLVTRARLFPPLQIAGDGALSFQRAAPIEPRVRIDGRRLELDFGDVDAETVIDAWQAEQSMVPLRGGGWSPLPTDWLQKHGQLLIDLLGARTADGTVARHATFALAELAENLDQPPPPDLARLRGLLDDFTTLPEPVLPRDLTAELRPYQKVGVQWLSFLREAGLGGILADDMGLGKTVQALAAIERPALVVCPTSVLDNWRAETARFRPAWRVSVYHGTERELDDADLTITSYALLRLDVHVLSDKRWRSIVLDEAQAIKNPESQVAQAAMRLQGDFKLALTGTPVENRLDELWSELHFTNPGLLGGRRDFQERTALPVARGERGAVERLRSRIRPFVLRRRKGEVAPELPPRTEMVLKCTLGPAERAVYDAVRASGQREYVEAVQAETCWARSRSCCDCARRLATSGWCRDRTIRRRRRSSICCARCSRRSSPKDIARSCSRSGRRCSIASSPCWPKPDWTACARRQHTGPRRCRPGLPSGRRPAGVPALSQGGAAWVSTSRPPITSSSSTRGGTRRRGSGRRSRAPDRTGQAGARAAARRGKHGRGTAPRAPGQEALARGGGARRSGPRGAGHEGGSSLSVSRDGQASIVGDPPSLRLQRRRSRARRHRCRRPVPEWNESPRATTHEASPCRGSPREQRNVGNGAVSAEHLDQRFVRGSAHEVADPIECSEELRDPRGSERFGHGRESSTVFGGCGKHHQDVRRASEDGGTHAQRLFDLRIVRESVRPFQPTREAGKRVEASGAHSRHADRGATFSSSCASRSSGVHSNRTMQIHRKPGGRVGPSPLVT